MADKLSVVQNAFWNNTQEKKPEGKYSIMRKMIDDFFNNAICR